MLKVRPPFADLRVHFAARTAQQQKIVGGAKARILEHAIRTAALALNKSRLHHPDLLHVAAEPAGNRQHRCL
jgi:hypothetical protein